MVRTEEQRRRHCEAQRKYHQTAKGKETLKRWEESTVETRAASSKARRLADPVKHRGNIEKSRERSRRYRSRHKEAIKQRLKSYSTSAYGKNARAARRAVSILVEVGIFLRPIACPACGENPGLTISGKSKIHFHHTSGYEKANWLVGEWLCTTCHGKKKH